MRIYQILNILTRQAFKDPPNCGAFNGPLAILSWLYEVYQIEQNRNAFYHYVATNFKIYRNVFETPDFGSFVRAYPYIN